MRVDWIIYMNQIRKTIKQIIKQIIKPPFQIFFYPYTYLFVFIFSEFKIYNLIYKDLYNNNKKKHFIFNKYLVDLNYYSLPNFLKKKLISSSMANPIEGVHQAEYYRSLEFPDKNFKKNSAFSYLQKYIEINKDKKIHIHQVGASSGREMNYFSNFSDSIIFEVSDISEEISINIKNNYQKLNCYCVDISNSYQLSKVAKRCNLIVAFGGLQYLLPKDLENFFKICKKENTEIIMSQPFDSQISPFPLIKSVPRGSFSWSHPYYNLAQKYKFTVEEFSIHFFPDCPWSQTVAAHFTN